METLFPAFVAVLAGLAFLYRVWVSSSTIAPSKPTPLGTKTEAETDSVSKESDFPPDWLTSKPIFELERRAIFSKKWIPLTQTSRFPTPGTYQTHNLANIPILLILGKDNILRAFHNVCRHRAYPVAKKESGTSTVLACRYHGWSYNCYGELIRAPHFDGVEGFERGENGLFEVGVRAEMGLVWVNLGGGNGEPEPEPEGLDGNGIEGSRWVGGGRLEGGFNWKGALRTKFLIDSLGLEEHQGSPSASFPFIHKLLGHFQPKPKSSSFHLFPSMFVFPLPTSRCWFSLSFFPVSERMTSIRYDLYSRGDMNKEDPTANAALAILEDKLKSMISGLEKDYKAGLITSIGQAGIVSDLDIESLATQEHILSLLKDHTKLEKSHGAEIYPARREPRLNVNYEHAEQLCRELDCGDPSTQKSLAW